MFNFLHVWNDSGYELSIDNSPIYSIIYINKCVDGKKYHTIPPVQRAAVWCEAVSVSWEKSSRSSLPNGCQTLVSSAGSRRYEAGLCWKPMRGCTAHQREWYRRELDDHKVFVSWNEQGTRAFSFTPAPCRAYMKKV